MIVFRVSIVFGLLFLGNCRPATLPEAQYRQWIADPKNGLHISQETPALQLDLQYQPPELMIAGADSAPSGRDSLLRRYRQSLNFVFTIGPREGKSSGDVMYTDLSDPAAYKKRMSALNFGMAEYWTLHTDSGDFHPVLTNVENTYGLTEYRKLHLAFAPPTPDIDLRASAKWDVRFNDEVFGTGIHHFVFWKKDWENVPELAK